MFWTTKMILLGVCWLLSSKRSSADYTFAVVPKRMNSPYWEIVKTGCETRAARLTKELGETVTCFFTGPAEGGPETEANQLSILEELLHSSGQQQIDGLALAVVESLSATNIINTYMNEGIPVVTFDSDAEESDRLAYIGTDNFAMGKELGRVLLQVKESGGTYGIIGAGSPNIALRMDGVRMGLNGTGWTEVSSSNKDCQGNPSLAVQQMHELVEAHPHIGAIIPVGAWPMFDAEAWMEFVDSHGNVVTVVGDSLQEQIDLMNTGYANALVGQLPFEMGTIAIDKLLDVVMMSNSPDNDNGNGNVENNKQIVAPFPTNTRFPTSFLDVINIPQDLPLVEDMNYIGSWRIFGYALCTIVCVLSIAFSAWTVWNRNARVVKASQPQFLLMTCLGIFVMASAIIPMGIDDEHTSQRGCNMACMAAPWLVSIGFVITFSALFSKTWRVNKVFRNPSMFQRIRVTEADVLKPFAVLFTANIIVLLCWTLISPLEYVRLPHSGTDHWNRVYKSYYGRCRYVNNNNEEDGGSRFIYVMLLVLINFIALAIANFQAYQARNIHVEFSESQYIGMAMVCMLQTFLVGTPILILMNENPVSTFIVESILIFFTTFAILIFIFVPKILRMHEHISFRRRNQEHQKPPPQRPLFGSEFRILSVRSSQSPVIAVNSETTMSHKNNNSVKKMVNMDIEREEEKEGSDIATVAVEDQLKFELCDPGEPQSASIQASVRCLKDLDIVPNRMSHESASSPI